MLQIKNLTLTHKKDLRILLEDFSLVLNDGDKAVIIGEEGNGKSTLLKWIYNPELIDDYIECDCEKIANGQKAKVLLLGLSLSDAKVLMLDEPTRNFSPLSGPVIRKMLREFPGAIISISHDRKFIDEVCDKVYILEDTLSSYQGMFVRNDYL